MEYFTRQHIQNRKNNLNYYGNDRETPALSKTHHLKKYSYTGSQNSFRYYFSLPPEEDYYIKLSFPGFIFPR